MSDLEGRCFIRRGGAFVPADFASEELMSSIKEGQEVIFTVRKPRSPQHHRWFFAMLRKVIENTEEQWFDEEDLLDDLKEAVGLAKRKVNPLTGRETNRVGSIAYANMGEAKFTRFVKRCSYVLATRVLNCTVEELMEETDDTQQRADLPPDRRRRRWWHKRERRPARSTEKRRLA